MKDSFQNSVDDSGRHVIDDTSAMRALAHPDRLSILLFLLSARSRTATECAAEVGISPSACSYHLRELERFAYAERVEASDDGRTRPWRAAAIGFSIGNDWSDPSPAARAARHALGRAELIENHRLAHRYLDAVDSLDAQWQNATDFHNFELVVTAEELAGLNEQVARLLRPYRAPTRTDSPDDAAAVHVVYQAFPRLDAT
ncbi:MAG: winged helix-turn-helix domain-containing protein [Actinomycetota bacterium]|nr:winged helix-turn-helix domain-containing protein [Actinomycetota bacterium]